MANPLKWLNRDDVDHYMLRYREPGSRNWQSAPIDEEEFQDPDHIEEHLPEDDVENAAETQNWPAGHYQLQGRKSNGGFTDGVWTFEIEANDDEVEDSTDELDPIEQLAQTQQMILDELHGGGARISDPGEARGAVFERALNGEIPEGADLERLDAFLKDWEDAEQSAPTNPDEVAGQLYQMQVAEGNTEAAAAILSDWFAAQGGQSDGSLMGMVRDGAGDLDVSMNTVKTLGLLKFIDDPRTITREALGGAIEGAAPGGIGRAAGGEQQRSGIQDLLSQQEGALPAGDPGEAGAGSDTDPDQGADDVDQEIEAAPAETAGGSGADLDLAVDDVDDVEEPDAPDAADPSEATEATEDPDDVGEDEIIATASMDDYAGPPREGAESGESGPETHSEVSAAPEVADAMADGQGDESESESVDDVLDELDDEADREGGDYPGAQDAMARASDAAREEEDDPE